MLLALFVSAAVLGQYGRAFFLSTLPWVILCAPFIQPLTSMLARVINDDHERARAIYLQFWQFTIAVPMFAGLLLAAYGGDAVSFLYGHQWPGAGQYLRLLSVAAAFFVTYSAAFSLAVVHGKVKELFGWALWMSPVYVVCFLVGVRYGPWGMAVGYSTAMTVAGISAVLLSARWLGIPASQLGKSSFAPACIAVGTAAVSIALRQAASAFTANWVLASGGSLALVGVGYSFLLYRFCPGVVGSVTRAARMAVSSAQAF
jgi:PST family polysaccharide transporter